MACSKIQSSSSSRTKQHFDVFVSFRGEDTRNNFTDHLFAALQRKGILAFRDNQNINKGELLEPELFQAIQQSSVFIVVFSRNYASSTWCMTELSEIVDWVEITGQRVLPIFFDVTPSEVRKQSGEFGKVFAEQVERFKDDLEMIIKWRKALKAITSHCGWDVQNKPQHEEIEKIVEEVINILGHNQIFSFEDDLVDMHSRVKQLEELLDLNTDGVVRVVGICGMGGIGKTTLANALFSKIKSQYDACCLIDDLSKIYKKFGVTSAQKQLLCQALKQGNMDIRNFSHGTMLVRTRLCQLKTLVVLDNVDDVEQVEKLALHPKYLGAGSRIIIISRDSHVLRNYGVDEVYNVQLLDKNHTLQLFCRKAFKSNYIVEEYQELTHDALNYVNGLPLAIKVLGSFLFDRDVSEWRSALTRMKENPSKNIMDVLRISFDGLEETEKEIFLDIACFISTYYECCVNLTVEKLLDYRGFYPEIGIKVLIEKSLISYMGGEIQMHDLLKELGKTIVREKAPNEPRKWSRLWNYKDFKNVMIKNEEAKNLEAIVISQYPYKFLKATLRVDALSKMGRLKLLILENVNFSGILNHLSNELRYLSWERYPFISLPSSFHSDQLVELILPYSNIKQLWEGTKYLPKLRTLNLKHSKNLIQMPDLKGVPHLMYLDFEGCVEIVRIHPSVGFLKELIDLSLKDCKNLAHNLNIIFELSSLRCLDLSGCSKLLNSSLLEKPRETEHLEKVGNNRSVIQLSSSSLYKVLMLPFHFLSSQKREDSLGLLVPYLTRLSSLLSLDLSFCNLSQIPDAIESLHSLEDLYLGGNTFVTLPRTIKKLSKLRILNLEHCKQLKYLPELPTTKGKTGVTHYGQVHIFDCPKLIDLEHCYSIIFSWLVQNLEVYLQPSISWGRIEIVIPGTQIPKWFKEQNEGSSISMDPPSSLMDNPNWIGVACCALFVTHDDPTVLGDDWLNTDDLCIGYNVQKKEDWSKSFIYVPIHFNKDLVTVELDHLIIVIYSREAFISNLEENTISLDNMVFKTYVFEPLGLHLDVKNCGYRWVFKEDLQQLNPSMMFSRDSSSRKRKLLTND